MNRVWLFRRRSRISLASMLFVATTALGHTQPITVQALSGLQYRYHGDTVWRERDTTATQSIYHRDTLYRSTYVFGRKTGSELIVVRGDSAKILETRDASGKLVSNQRPFDVAASSFEFERTGIESAYRLLESEESRRAMDVRSRESEERARASGFNLPPRPVYPTVDYSPKEKQIYPVSANRTIESLGDTVRYINGCSARPPVDTSIFLLFGADSVKRLSPAPRTFDAMMARAVRGDLSSGFTRRQVRGRDNPAMKNVPGFDKWPCDRRP